MPHETRIDPRPAPLDDALLFQSFDARSDSWLRQSDLPAASTRPNGRPRRAATDNVAHRAAAPAASIAISPAGRTPKSNWQSKCVAGTSVSRVRVQKPQLDRLDRAHSSGWQTNAPKCLSKLKCRASSVPHVDQHVKNP